MLNPEIYDKVVKLSNVLNFIQFFEVDFLIKNFPGYKCTLLHFDKCFPN